MAARWGTGEEIIKTCKMEYFPPSTCEEPELLQEGICSLQHNSLDTEDAFESLQSCLDSSILSIFESSSAAEVKNGINEENEATLLTALTEILDNVDDENLSPFDTLPDMGLLQVQGGNDHSLLQTILSFSCSPDKESLFNSGQIPEMMEDEEIDTNFPEFVHDLNVSSELDMCLPISLEHDGEIMAFTLGDLVKHMHPYAMTLCVEGKEELLSDGGIILEVMDKGEHGEPILAIQDLSIPLSLSSANKEQCVPKSVPKNVKPKPEGVPAGVMTNGVSHSQVQSVIKHEKESSVKCLSKNVNDTPLVKESIVKDKLSKPDTKVSDEESEEEQRTKKRVSFATDLIASEDRKRDRESFPEVKNKVQIDDISSSSSLSTSVPQALVSQSALMISATKPSSGPKEKDTLGMLHEHTGGNDTKQDPAATQASETKPKSISLQQYRLLRQQKKPTPTEKIEDNKTKWPTLPEAPKELPPIPHLPDPSTKDSRHTGPSKVKDSIPEIMPAWQPRGPGAPPTPEALLFPPASMQTSSKKAVNTKPVSSFSSKNAENQPTIINSSVPHNQCVADNGSQNTVAKVTCAAVQVPVNSTSLLEEPKNDAPQNTHAQVTFPDSGTKGIFKKCDYVMPQNVNRTSNRTTKDDDDNTVLAASPTLRPDATSKTVTERPAEASVPKATLPAQPVRTLKPTVCSQRHVAPIAGQPFSSAPIQARIMRLAEQMRKDPARAPKTKSPTAELIESFTTEIGIEATDLASLLEQFEENQPKEKQRVSEVYGGAGAVGNSSMGQQVQTAATKKACSPDLASTAGLTPPATPPHQMWKPLAPVALLGKQNKSETPNPSTTKVFSIASLTLPANKLGSKPQTSFNIKQSQPFSQDHDYCLLPNAPCQNEEDHNKNSIQQPKLINSELLSDNTAMQSGVKHNPGLVSEERDLIYEKSHHSVPSSQTERVTLTSTGMVTPDASPERPNSAKLRRYSECSSSSYQKRGRSQRKYRTRLTSRSGSMSSSSRSRSPPRKRYRSSSSSRSPSKYRSCSRSCSRSPSPCNYGRSYSSSSSRSWSCSQSRSRSRSRSPSHRRRRLNSSYSPNRRSSQCYDSRYNDDTGHRKQKAIEERRVVYIGRIRGDMTRKELRERFSYFGEIEDCTVHFREHGDNYGFVTYYDKKDAFNAIENGSKLRQQNELPFDLCFGGRRQFCGASYSDLDSNRSFDPAPAKARFDALDFDTLLKQAQRNLKR